MTEKKRPERKERIVFPYKKICIEGEEVGRLYLVGTTELGKKENLVSVLLSFKKTKYSGYFAAIITSNHPAFTPEDFFFTSSGTINDISGKNELLFGRLKRPFPKEGNIMGLIKRVAERMGTVLGKNLPSLEDME